MFTGGDSPYEAAIQELDTIKTEEEEQNAGISQIVTTASVEVKEEEEEEEKENSGRNSREEDDNEMPEATSQPSPPPLEEKVAVPAPSSATTKTIEAPTLDIFGNPEEEELWWYGGKYNFSLSLFFKIYVGRTYFLIIVIFNLLI